jgi:aspartyl protease family protein
MKEWWKNIINYIKKYCNISKNNKTMGHIYVTVKLGDLLKKEIRDVKMLVDTGATYPCIPKWLAEALGLRLEFKIMATLADGRIVETWYATAYIEIIGRGDLIPIRVLDVDEPLLGVFTLEALGLAVDPLTGEVKPTRTFIARA